MQNLEKIIYYISSLFNSLVINRRMPATCSLNRFQKVHVTIIKNKARSHPKCWKQHHGQNTGSHIVAYFYMTMIHEAWFLHVVKSRIIEREKINNLQWICIVQFAKVMPIGFWTLSWHKLCADVYLTKSHHMLTAPTCRWFN